MKPFIYSILLFFSLNSTFSQTEEVILKKSFSANKNTILNLDLNNVAIIFEESFDDKIHFDYVMIFGKYSKRKREIILKQTKVKTLKRDDLITLKVNNSEFSGNHVSYFSDYDVNNKDSILVSLKDFFKREWKRNYNYKTKDSLLNDITKSQGSDLDGFFKKNQKKFKDNKFFKKNKVIVKIFSIKLPKYINLRIKSIKTNLNFNYDLSASLSLDSFKDFLKFKNIISTKNYINSNNGIIQMNSLTNGEVRFRDMSKVLIGSISNTKLNSETSKIQIGEIDKNVSITDFDSKFYTYNFSNSFVNFNLTGDYSELNFYNVKEQNYAMDVFGFNTALNLNKVKATFPVTKDKKLIKILEKRPKNNSLNKIDIELKNGILNIK